MSIVGVWPLKLERGADFQLPPFTYYSTWTGDPTTSTAFNFTGMSADCMFRATLDDSAAVVLSLTPTLGGTAGTYALPLITAANIETLWAAFQNGCGWWDCRFTNSGSPVRFADHSPVKISQAVTR